MSGRGRVLGAFSWALALMLASATGGRALPPPRAPTPGPAPSEVPRVAGPTLPFGSTLLFVLDDTVNSGSTRAGTTVHLHLKSALVVNGVTLAPAGAPATLTVVATRPAQSGNVDGAIAIHLDPLTLPGRGEALPIRAFHEYVEVETSAGRQSTLATTDTIGDIFIPGHVLYHALRKGHQMVLPAGSVLRAQTAATIDARDPRRVVLATPAPFVSNYDTPHADLTAPPFYTPAPQRPRPLPKGKPTLPPSPAASAAASAAPSPAAATSAIPAGTGAPPPLEPGSSGAASPNATLPPR